MPALRPIDQAVALPIEPDMATASGTILTAIGAGALTPDQAMKIAGTIASLAKTREVLEIESRIVALEELLKSEKAG